MKRETTDERSTKRNHLLLKVAAIAVFGCGTTMGNEISDSSLVNASIEDCCSSMATMPPCAPTVGSQPVLDGCGVTEVELDEGQPHSEEGNQTSMNQRQFETPELDAPAMTSQFEGSDVRDRFTASSPATSLASTAGSAGGLDAPNMFGDFLSIPLFIDGSDDKPLGFFGTRRFKVADNVSPVPQDRVYYNFQAYRNALVNESDAGDRTLENFYRHSFGFEKTFADGLFSSELRMVVADGFDYTQIDPEDDPLARGAEFGNLQMAFKTLLHSTSTFSAGCGLVVTVPTADDLVLVDDDTVVENESVFLAPFFGFVSQPCRNGFVQGFVQTDFTLGGDTVSDNGVVEGIFQEQNLLFLSLSAGSWIYTNEQRGACLNGVATMLEMHYTSTMNDGDPLIGGPADLEAENRFDQLNLMGGFVLNRGLTNIRLAAGVPLREEGIHTGADSGRRTDEPFDAEFQVSLNRFF